MPKRGEVIEIKISSNMDWRVTKGEKFIFRSYFFRNGEGWYRVIDSYGEKRELPDTFFMNIPPKPTRKAYH